MAWRRPTGRANATSSGHWSSGWKWLRATSILCFGSTHIRVITIPKKKVCNFVGGVVSPLLCNIFLHQLDKYMVNLGANRVQSKREQNQRRSATYHRVDNAIFRARRNLRGNPDRLARRELLTKLEELEKERRHTPYYEMRHQTK